MEHIVQFAVGVDDERIQQIMEEKAADIIAKEIKDATRSYRVYGDGYAERPDKLEAYFHEEVEKIVKEHREEIIDAAIEKAVTKIVNAKKVKEALGEVLEGS